MNFKYFKLALRFIFLIGLFFSETTIFAQHTILDRFDAVEINGTVRLECVVSSGNTCNGIDFLRSEDSINYEIIGHIGGVCGSSSTPITYNFIDEQPIKNKTIYYKLKLGTIGYSDALSIQVVDTDKFGFQIRPNPANERAIIYFKNDANEEHTIVLFNNIGMPALFKNTTSNFFELDLKALTAGIYTFAISKSTIIGRIVVQH